MWPRWDWRCRPAPIFPQTTATEHLSANTEAGIERLSTATRLSSCRSAAESRAAPRKMSSQVSSMRTITRGDGRLAWQWIALARCWSPTMSETRSGAYHRLNPFLHQSRAANRADVICTVKSPAQAGLLCLFEGLGIAHLQSALSNPVFGFLQVDSAALKRLLLFE